MAQTPQWNWAKALGGTASDVGNSIAVDAVGNVYSTGYFSDTVDFDLGTGVFNLISTGLRDAFISKLDSLGNFIWARAIGGTTYHESGSEIVVDNSGNGDVYTAGIFYGTSDFDPGPGTYYLNSAGSADIFISKLDSAGNFVWARQMGGSDVDYGFSIALDSSGHLYTTGQFNGTADFDPGIGTYNFTCLGAFPDIFISKLDSTGNFIWAKQLGGVNSDKANSVSIDVSGNVYTTGYFRATVDFDPGVGVFNLTASGDGDIFISKLDAAGNFIWAKNLEAADYASASKLVIDRAGTGDIYITGSFSGLVDFDPSAGTYYLTDAGSGDIFITRLDSAGNFVWAKSIGGVDADEGNSISIDAFANIYTTGSFNAVADFDPGPGIFNLTSTGGWEIFVSKLNSGGDFQWAKSAGGTGYDYGRFITLDVSGKVLITGMYHSTIFFDTISLPDAASEDIFIARLETSIFAGLEETGVNGNEVILFPNPATTNLAILIADEINMNVIVTVSDVAGKNMYTFKPGNCRTIGLNTSKFEPGVYFVGIQTTDNILQKKLIIEK